MRAVMAAAFHPFQRISAGEPGVEGQHFAGRGSCLNFVNRHQVQRTAVIDQPGLGAWRGIGAEAQRAGPWPGPGAARQQGGRFGQFLRFRCGGMDQRFKVAPDQAGIDIACLEIIMFQQLTQEPGIGAHRPNLGLVDPGQQGLNGFGTGCAVDNQLGNHRIVEGRNLAPFLNPSVDPQVVSKTQMLQRAGCRQEAPGRVFGIEPGFHRPAIDGQFVLFERQRLASGNPQLPFNQIDPGDLFGHGVFHLQTGVHFHEPDPVRAQACAGVGDELDRAGALIVDRLGRADGCGAELGAGRLVHAGGRGFLDHLLVAALETAITLEQVDDIALAVAEHLHLDMARALDVFLDQDMGIAEAGCRFALARGKGIGKVCCRLHQPHPLAAAAGHGLDQHRIADLCGALGQEAGLLILAHVARGHRNAGCSHQLLGGILQAHRFDARRFGADPDQPGGYHGAGKFCVFGQEAVTRVDRLCTRGLGGGDDLFAHQIAFAGRAGANMHRLIGLAHVQRAGIGIGIDCNRANSHRPGSADNAAGNLAAVGNQQGLDHGLSLGPVTARCNAPCACFEATLERRANLLATLPTGHD